MPRFETIAKPHRDILRGDFTMDTYAARLWSVVNRGGPAEYRDAKRFFQKTYMTRGLDTLLRGVERRLKGRGGDSAIKLQTPFGGGKTHTLIALYHKAKAWDAKPFVVVGSELNTQTTLWGEMEMQLTGHIQRFKGRVAPGIADISKLLSESGSPVLILMDEMLHYLTRAAGTSVGQSTLAEQTLTFIQSLTESVAAAKNVALVVTMQSGALERYGEKAEALGSRFEKVLDRIIRKMTPVADAEIAPLIRQRLFTAVDISAAKSVIREFVNYADRESILPIGTQKSEYRERFVESYPFQPEVIDVLYQRWGGYPTFQRTRGVLRLLSRVVSRASRQNLPYITLADFDLSNEDIQGQLLEHAGNEYSSILSKDVTAPDAGAKSVDSGLGGTNTQYALGTRAATAIFLYSFTGGMERGATLTELKRSATRTEVPAATIDAAANQLTEHLFYLRHENGKYYFDTQPTLTRVVKVRMANIEAAAISKRVDALLRAALKSQKTDNPLKVIVAPKESRDVKDIPELQLIVLPNPDDDFIQQVLDTCGGIPRTYRNTLFFLTPSPDGMSQLEAEVKKHLAYQQIQRDTSLNLSDAQKKEVKDRVATSKQALDKALRQCYRILRLPTRNTLGEEEIDYDTLPLVDAIYDQIRYAGSIQTSIAPQVIERLYLKGNDTLSTEKLFQASLRTPGEPRLNRDAWVVAIGEGVREGIFGLGAEIDGKLEQYYFKEDVPPEEINLTGSEVLITAALCKLPKSPGGTDVESSADREDGEKPTEVVPPVPPSGPHGRKKVHLKFQVPAGKVYETTQVLAVLQERFSTIELEVTAAAGEISESDYQNSVLEAFDQLGIEVAEVE